MGVHGKRLEDIKSSFDRADFFNFSEAVDILKKSAEKTKFKETVDVSFMLGVNPRKSDQMVRGACQLPKGTGKEIKVLAIVPADMVEDAKNAGADYAGGKEYAEKIQKEGWLDFDKVVTVPQMMKVVGPLGKVLGPRGLMPTPKTGTVSKNITETIKMQKAGRVEFRVNRDGILACPIGKINFSEEDLYENMLEVFRTLNKLKPASAKGIYFRKIVLTTTMGPGVKLNKTELVNAIS